MAFQDIIVSGARPTGHLHLGNYLGAVKQFVRMQEEYPVCYFFIADLHSLTTHTDPVHLHEGVRTVLVEYLASGLDPEKITLYRQSDIPEIPELYLFLNMHAYKGELERVPTFKEKARKHPDNINAGLLTYPTLMAADILIHKGTKVPVGKDQEQHLEMTRDFAVRFNTIYQKEIFPEPIAFNMGGKLVKVPGLDGKGKMSKSDNPDSCIFLADSGDGIWRKMKKAVTDSGPQVPGQEKSEPVQNLFSLMEHVSNEETYNFFDTEHREGRIRYGDMKKKLAEDMTAYLAPIRERILELEKDTDYLTRVLREGAEKARISARQVISEVREAAGFRGI